MNNFRNVLTKSGISKLDVSGKNISDLLNINYRDLNNLNERDLKSITSRLVSAANKRLRRLGKSKIGKYSPAYKSRNGKSFSVKGKDWNQTRNELSEVIEFLKATTSSMVKTKTSKGFSAHRKKTYQRLGIKIGTWTIEEEIEFWKEYRMFEEGLGGESALKTRYNSTNLQQRFAQEYTEKLKSDNLQDVTKTLKELNQKIYEEKQAEDEEVTDAFSHKVDL